MVMEEEHPMDEPTPKVARETLEAEEQAKEVPAAVTKSDDTPIDEMLSDTKSLRSVGSSKKESPVTEEPVKEEKPEETPVVEEEKKEEEDALAAPTEPTSEGKEMAMEEAVEVEKEEEVNESTNEEAAEVEDISEEAKRETNKLKGMFGTMRKSIKKKVTKLKAKRSSKKKEAAPDESPEDVQEQDPNPAESELDVPKLVDDKLENNANPAEGTPEDKEDTDDEAAENEEIISSLRGTVLSLEEENKELKRRMMRLKAQLSGEPQQPFDERVTDTLATKEFENMSPDEKIKQLDSQVQKWQKLYLESNEIGPSRIEKLEEGCDEVSTMAKSTSGNTNYDDKESKGDNEDRILMLEYQLRESVKVLKTAQKKMVAQHEKEFHLQKTVDDLSEQINELNGQVQKANDSEASMKMQWEQEQKSKLEAEAQLTQERQRLDDFREDLGLAPLYKNEVTVVDDQVEQQIQTNNSSIFCWGSPAQPISQ